MAASFDLVSALETPLILNFSKMENGNDTTAGGSATNMPKLKFFVVFIYAFLSLAVFFNLRVIYMVLRILTTRKTNLNRHDGNRHAFIYVLSLSIVDALVLAHLPLVATDILLSRWIFGDAVCKLYWLIEQVNRILSTFILTALSADRYLAVCFPLRFARCRTTVAASCVIGVCVLVAGSLLAPTSVYSHVVEWEVSNHTIAKCMFAMDATTSNQFLTYMFICGYCVPFISMVFFYASILRMLWRRHTASTLRNETMEVNENVNFVWTNGGNQRQHRAQHVTHRALVLVTFYFFCWSPYWLVMFYIQFSLAENEMGSNDGMIITIYAVHILVYVNSAVNPLLYALLNKELQRQHSSLLHRNRDQRAAGSDQRDVFLSQNRNPHRQSDSIFASRIALNGSHGDLLREQSADTPMGNGEPLLKVVP